MSLVAAAAACNGAVALAKIRSTPSEVNPLTIVAQFAGSPEAFWTSKLTLSSPNFSIKASWKPSVAASRAGCCTSWTIPIL